MSTLVNRGINAPRKQDHHHDGGDLHNAQSFFAGFFDAFDVLPPEVTGDDHSNTGRGIVDVELMHDTRTADQEARHRGMMSANSYHFVNKTDDILSGGYARDRSSQNVIKHQGGDTDLGKCAAERFLHNSVDSAPCVHGAALHIESADRVCEEHDAKDEPWCRLADCFFCDSAGVKS